MEIKKKLAHRSNYGSSRTISSIKYIVIHYTANDGDKAWNNANYFANNANLKASAHYFVDDDYVYQSVPDEYVAYSVGANSADTSKGGGKYYNKCTNSNSISIELCDTNKNGSIYPTQKTIDRAIALTKELMGKYNIDTNHVIRHFDVTGKLCPKYWVDNTKWNNEFHSKLKSYQGWIFDDENWWYSFSDGTFAKNGWYLIDSAYYYFDSSGWLLTNQYIKSNDYDTNKALYYVDDSGAWDGETYRWMSDDKGWWITKVGGNWYPTSEWAFIDGKWYYFDERGYIIRNQGYPIDGITYQFDADGALIL